MAAVGGTEKSTEKSDDSDEEVPAKKFCAQISVEAVPAKADDEGENIESTQEADENEIFAVSDNDCSESDNEESLDDVSEESIHSETDEHAQSDESSECDTEDCPDDVSQEFILTEVDAPNKPSPPLRKFKRIPVFIAEYHNDVLHFIFDATRSRFLPCTGNTLIHYDSHPDMVIPRDLSAELAYDRTTLLNECSIESWIMPMCFTGLITRIVWIKNACCQQLPLGKHNFNIGIFNERLNVDLALPYFLSEGSVCATAQLKQPRAIELLVVNDTVEASSEKWFSRPNETYILDIDLDFFSTKNPFLDLYKKCDNYYEGLAEIFALEALTLNDDNIAAANERRVKKLDALRNFFLYLEKHDGNCGDYDQHRSTVDEHTFSQLTAFVEKLLSCYKQTEIDWMQIYDAGCTSDSGGLPTFLASSEELAASFERFHSQLHGLPHNPVLVTISRSSEDEFCPKTLVEEIQNSTLHALGQKFDLHTPIRADKDEGYNVLKL